MVNVNEIFTREEFDYIVRRMSGESYFPNVLNESRSYREAKPGYKTIFLSHSHFDDSGFNKKCHLFFKHKLLQKYKN